jgi:hypothetical protein
MFLFPVSCGGGCNTGVLGKRLVYNFLYFLLQGTSRATPASFEDRHVETISRLVLTIAVFQRKLLNGMRVLWVG